MPLGSSPSTFGTLGGAPGDNVALAAALDAKLDLTGGTLTGGLIITQGTANASILSSTGYSLTGSDATSMIDFAGTWNTTGAPTAIKLNITDTASDAASLLMDLQVDTTSKFSVSKGGALSLSNGASALAGSAAMRIASVGSGVLEISSQFTKFTIQNGGAGTLISNTSGRTTVGNSLGISSDIYGNNLTVLSSLTGGNILQLGTDHATTPTAQTLVSHSVTTGTGANMIIGAGTGSVAGGSVILATRATTGALVDRVTVRADGKVVIEDGTAFAPWLASNPGLLSVGRKDTGANYVSFGLSARSGVSVILNGGFVFSTSSDPTLGLSSGGGHGWGVYGLAQDVTSILGGTATNAQKLEVYGTRTDASNYERLSFVTAAGAYSIKPEAAGTGTLRDLHISGLPTSNPGPGILWNNAGTPAIGT